MRKSQFRAVPHIFFTVLDEITLFFVGAQRKIVKELLDGMPK